MTFPFPWASGYSRAKATWVGTPGMNSSNLTSYSFTGVSLGGPGLYAFVVLGNGGLSSLTVGGVPANIVTETNQSGNTAVIAYLRVASSAAVTLLATYSAQVGSCCIGIYRITGNKKDAPLDKQPSYSAGVTSRNITLNVPRGCAAVFGCHNYNGSSTPTISWVGANLDSNVPNSTDRAEASFASIGINNSLVAAKSVTANATVSGQMGLSGVSWR